MTIVQTETKKKWGTQTWIGKRFSLSGVAVGKILTRVGLKQGAEATSKAMLTGHAKKCFTEDGRYYYMWDFDGVCEIVEEALVQESGPKVDKLVQVVKKALVEAHEHRVEGNDFIAELLEAEAYDGIPPGLVRVVKRRLSC